MKTLTYASLWAATGLIIVLASNAFGSGLFQVRRTGKVTPWQAMSIAEARAHGRAIQATYEFEDGKWGYAVIVASKGKLSEVELNAVTGKVGDVESADPAGEAHEFESELKAAMKR